VFKRTYSNVPLLHKNYFLLLAQTRGYDILPQDIEEAEDKFGYKTYNIVVTTRETDNLMQKVFEEANN
jgi:hypothetical protein